MAAFKPIATPKRRMRLADGTIVLVDANSVPAPQTSRPMALPEPGKSAYGLGALPQANDATTAVAAPVQVAPNTDQPSAPNISNVLGALSDLAQSKSQPTPQTALPQTTGNDFADRAHSVPVLDNIASGFRGALQAASQPRSSIGNILSYGALSALYPNDMRAEAQAQQIQADNAARRARSDKDRTFNLDALKELVGGTNNADKNTNEATQNANTATYNQGKLRIDEGNLAVNQGELGVHRQNASREANNQTATNQAKADEGFNASLQRYQGVGKAYDPLKQMMVDVPGQAPLPFENVLERAAYDNPNSTQGKNWAYTHLRQMQNGLQDYVRSAKTPQDAEKRKTDYVNRMNAKAKEIRTKFNLTGE